MLREALSVALAFVVGVAALAQDDASAPAESSAPPAGAPESAIDEDARDRIVVIGRDYGGLTLRQYVREFVVDVSDPISRNYGFARWDQPICVGVENLDEEAAQYIVDRISQVALEVGLEPEGPGCQPTIAIVFTTDGQALASRLVEERPRSFRPFGGTGGTTQGWQALQDFATSDAPVRWWQITMVVSDVGLKGAPNYVAINLPGRGPVGVASYGASRIRSYIFDELWSSFIIVDAAKLDGVSWRQLADYLAVVALVQVDPNADPTFYDSILNLFDADRPAARLTEWDRSYLRAIYDLNLELRPNHQRGALVSLMTRQERRAANGN